MHKLLRHLGLCGTGVEVGVWRGDFSEQLLETTELRTLVSVDAWDAKFCKAKWTQKDLDEAYNECRKRLSKFHERSRIIKATSVEAAAMFEDKSLDFVYIDAGHDYDSVKQDLEVWWPKLRKDALFAGHDYFNRPGQDDWGVVKAVDEHAALHNVQLYVCDENGQKWKSWFCIKVAKGCSPE